jgi:hypothetical protein
MSMTLLEYELKKQLVLLYVALTAVNTTVTFAARLCVRNINTGGFTNEKIQQH